MCKNVRQKCIQLVRSFGVRKMPFLQKKRGEMLHKKRGRIQKPAISLFSQLESVRKRRNVFFFSGYFASCWLTLPGGIKRGPDSVRVFRVFFHSPRTYRKFWLLCLHADFVFGVMDGGTMLHCSCKTHSAHVAATAAISYEDGRGEGKQTRHS